MAARRTTHGTRRPAPAVATEVATNPVTKPAIYESPATQLGSVTEPEEIWVWEEPTRSLVLGTIRCAQKPEVTPQERRRNMQKWYPTILGAYKWRDTEFKSMSGVDREAASLLITYTRRFTCLESRVVRS